MPAGILVIDKPVGLSSRRVTDRVARTLSEKRAGHVGTLDPLASGVLAVALGAATRLVPFLEPSDKIYRCVVRLGAATNTQDAEGEVTATGDFSRVTASDLAGAAAGLTGEVLQVPPMFSAVKQGGVALYKLARKGMEVERAPRPVRVDSIAVEDFSPPDATLLVHCGPGVYVRTLAHDLGERLGCHAHLVALTRLQSGPFTLAQAVPLDALTEDLARARLIAPADCLPHLPAFPLDDEQLLFIRQGKSLPAPAGAAAGLARLLHGGALAAVAMVDTEGEAPRLRPVRVLAGES